MKHHHRCSLVTTSILDPEALARSLQCVLVQFNSKPERGYVRVPEFVGNAFNDAPNEKVQWIQISTAWKAKFFRQKHVTLYTKRLVCIGTPSCSKTYGSPPVAVSITFSLKTHLKDFLLDRFLSFRRTVMAHDVIPSQKMKLSRRS